MKPLRFFLTIAVLLAAAGLNQFLHRPEISIPRKDLKEFPATLDKWTAISDQQMDGLSMKILQADDYLMRNYVDSGGKIIGLYIGFFKSQREGKAIHSPRQCLPGAGWVPILAEVRQIPIHGYNSKVVSINKLLIGKGMERDLYIFWYQGRGRIYASEYWNKIYLMWDALTRKRTDGALIRISCRVDGHPEETLKKQTDFMEVIIPLLKEYIPN